MELSEKQKHELKKFVKDLENHRGRHTELVSVYVPSGYDLNKILSHLADEQGTATNIKSSQTRKNVIDALEKMIQHLKIYKRTPENGLAVFSGNVAEREGQQDFKVWSIEPPIPLRTRIYRCDKEFVLELLRDMLDTKEVYGLMVVDRRDASLAYLKGKTIVPILKTHSEVPGKTRAGGQSAARFERLREGAKVDHFKKVADYMKEQFLDNNNLKGIIVGGPGPTKYDFIEGGYLTNELRKKVIAIKDLSYTGDFGLSELVDKCGDILAKEGIMEEKKILGKFFEILSTKQGMVSYGVDATMNMIKIGAVDILLISESLNDKKIEEFEKEAKLVGSEVKIISTETSEGVQLRDLGKVAAILRYEASTNA
jgi:peptide chain release factor subunit 1